MVLCGNRQCTLVREERQVVVNRLIAPIAKEVCVDNVKGVVLFMWSDLLAL